MNDNNPIKVSFEMFGEPVLACPECGAYCIHPVGIECHSPGMHNGVLTVSAAGISLDPKPEPEGRGTRIILKFLGECGHKFEHEFRFHKGQTFIKTRISLIKILMHDFLGTIWRD